MKSQDRTVTLLTNDEIERRVDVTRRTAVERRAATSHANTEARCTRSMGEPWKDAMGVIGRLLEDGRSHDQILAAFEDTPLCSDLRAHWGDEHDERFAHMVGVAAEGLQPHMEAADALGWGKGRVASTARRVYQALRWLERRASAQAAGSSFTASVRELSDLTRIVSCKSIRRALDRLQALGYLEADEQPRSHNDARAWRLLPLAALNARREAMSITDPTLLSTHVDAKRSGDRNAHSPFHDVWAPAALGPNAQRVWERLRQGPATVAQLHRELGISRGGLSRGNRDNPGVLQRLQRCGLARQLENRSWEAVAADLDQVAQELGVLGKRDQLRAVHAEERQERERALSGAPRPTNWVWVPSGRACLKVVPETGEIAGRRLVSESDAWDDVASDFIAKVRASRETLPCHEELMAA